MNETSMPTTVRLIRRIWPRRSELMRPVDWIQAALLIAVITVTVVLLPIALALGSETYAGSARVGEEQSRTRHQTTAILIRDAPPTSVGTRGQVVINVSKVPARWTLPDGSERTGTVLADNGSHAGTAVPVWLDEAGYPVPEPIPRDQAAAAGVAVTLGFWAAAAGLLIGIFLATRAWLNRCRTVAWEREWTQVEPDWTHRAS